MRAKRILDGFGKVPKQKYFDNKDIIQQEVNYKDDAIDGIFRYYNEEGQVVLEYEYKNGEKIGGGEIKQ